MKLLLQKRLVIEPIFQGKLLECLQKRVQESLRIKV